jgi:hypothetical protein
LELLDAAPDRDRVEELASSLAGLRQGLITPTGTDAAIWTIRELAARGSADASACVCRAALGRRG